MLAYLKSIGFLIWCAGTIICTWSLAAWLMCLTQEMGSDDDNECFALWEADFESDPWALYILVIIGAATLVTCGGCIVGFRTKCFSLLQSRKAALLLMVLLALGITAGTLFYPTYGSLDFWESATDERWIWVPLVFKPHERSHFPLSFGMQHA